MRRRIFYLLLSAFLFTLPSCKKNAAPSPTSPTAADNGYPTPNHDLPATVGLIQELYANFPEAFESGLKESYAAGDVSLSTGSWHFDNALIGSSTSDTRNGNSAARLTGAGSLSMNFDVANGASEVRFGYALFGNDTAGSFELWYSVTGGNSWVLAGGIATVSNSLATAVFPINIAGPIRFQIRKTGGNRINIDDFGISDYTGNTTAADTIGGPATRDDNLGLGNPSGAANSNSNNYLIVKTQYTLSYNNGLGRANWVSWHLSSAWKGSATRCDCFTSDNTLPAAFYHAGTSKYTNTGFDRGHLCPSDDRDANSTDNAATFLMTNITPQSPVLNQQTWGDLEDYCRSMLASGNELYIIAGAYGQGGGGSLGGATNTIASGSINVPAHYWKVVVILPIGKKDVTRVSTTTRVIAVDMPNQQSVNSHAWGYYRTSVDAIEAATGYDFLNNVPASIQSHIEAVTDNGPSK